MKRLKYVRNKQELEAYISKEMMPVMEKVGDEMISVLQEQIEKDVYQGIPTYNQRYYGGYYGDLNTGFYQPTYDFLDAWNFRVTKNNGNPRVKVYFVPSALSKTAHASITNPENDPRKNLADILNNAFMDYGEGYTSSLSVGGGENQDGEVWEPTMVSKHRKPYWKRYVEKMTKRGGIRNAIKSEAKNAGINLE